MNDSTIYKGYEIRYVYDCHRAPTARWLPTVIHPTERGVSIARRTVAGCKQVIDAIKSGRIRFGAAS
jgi:hypothetical protein